MPLSPSPHHIPADITSQIALQLTTASIFKPSVASHVLRSNIKFLASQSAAWSMPCLLFYTHFTPPDPGISAFWSFWSLLLILHNLAQVFLPPSSLPYPHMAQSLL